VINNKPILEFFNDNPNKAYEIVFVLDINFCEYPYYYRVLVKDINTDYYTTILVPPELLRYRYRIGTVYKGNKSIGKNNLLNVGTFSVNNFQEHKLIQLKDVINDQDFNLITYDYFKKFYLKQYCYSLELEHCHLIIPTYTIANRFYFLSSSMKKAVFNGALSSLCYDKEFFKKDETVYITIKQAAAKRDLPFICRFLENSYAMNSFNYFLYQKCNQHINTPYGQIKAKFPVKEEFEIDVSYIQLNNYPKPKLLVIDIFNDTSSFNFSKIHVKKFTSKTNTVSSEDIAVSDPKKFKRKKPRKINRTIKQGVPSSEYHLNLDNDIGEKDRNTNGIEIEIEDVYKISEGEPSTEYTNNAVNPSFENAKPNGSDNLIQTSYSFYGESENSNRHIFNINDFYMLFELLSQQLGVNVINISNLINIIPIENTKKNISSKYYLSSNNLRSFLFADFYYIDKYIFIIEIELDESWQAISTWFFISNNYEFMINENIAQDIISNYIGECKTYVELEKYVLDKYGLSFYKKAHVKKVNEEYLLNHWVEDVLDDLVNIS